MASIFVLPIPRMSDFLAFVFSSMQETDNKSPNCASDISIYSGKLSTDFLQKWEYGQKYIIDFPLNHQNKTAIIPSVWIIRNDEKFPRLVTCYVL